MPLGAPMTTSSSRSRNVPLTCGGCLLVGHVTMVGTLAGSALAISFQGG